MKTISNILLFSFPDYLLTSNFNKMTLLRSNLFKTCRYRRITRSFNQMVFPPYSLCSLFSPLEGMDMTKTHKSISKAINRKSPIITFVHNPPTIFHIIRLFPSHKTTIHDTLIISVQILHSYNVDESTLSACHLLSHTLSVPWCDNGFSLLLSCLEHKTHPLSFQYVSSSQLRTFSSLLIRRIQHEPIPYILSQWDFHSITISVRPPCLVPRPETEQLVESILDEMAQYVNDNTKIRILDVGCGSGVIGLTLASNLRNVEVVLIDCHPESIALTHHNAYRALEDKYTNRSCCVIHSSVIIIFLRKSLISL